MSREDVELVRRLQPGPHVDLVALFRDEDLAARSGEAIAPFFHPDFKCVTHLGAEGRTYVGMDGLRSGWLEWLAPWAAYRAEIEECVGVGERVLVLVRDFGRPEPGAPEVEQVGASIWTVRDGKVARAEFYANRTEALEAAGLRGRRGRTATAKPHLRAVTFNPAPIAQLDRATPS